MTEAGAMGVPAAAPAEAERFARSRVVALMGLVLATVAALWPTLLTLRERWEDTYNWTVKWNMTVPGATYENTVDNRAWG